MNKQAKIRLIFITFFVITFFLLYTVMAQLVVNKSQIIEFQRDGYKYSTLPNGIIMSAESDYHCSAKPDKINDGYKVCSPIINILNNGTEYFSINPLDVASKGFSQFDKFVDIQKNLNLKANVSGSGNYLFYEYSTDYKFYNEIKVNESCLEDHNFNNTAKCLYNVTQIQYNNWSRLKDTTDIISLINNLKPGQRAGIRLNFEVPQYKGGSYNFTLPYLNWALDPPVSSCQTLSVSGIYTLSQNLSTSGNCLTITSNDVTVDLNGFSITGDGSTGTGITDSSSSNVTVKNGRIAYFSFNFQTTSGKNVTVQNITSINSNGISILVFGSATNITVYNSNLTGNISKSVCMELLSNSNNISLNNFSSCSQGLLLSSSSSNIIDNNIFQNNNATSHGALELQVGSSNNNITNNIFNSGNNVGVVLISGSNNRLINDTISGSLTAGITFTDSGSYIVNSTITGNNGDGGLRFDTGNGNSVIYNNLFNNTINFANTTTLGTNFWNTTKTSETNIVGKTFFGGNAWFTPTGTGFSDTCWDNTGDWICENPYTLATGNIDYLPLTLNQDLIAPFITLNNPVDTYNSTATSNIFSATISDSTAVKYVSLYANFSGSWAINQTNTSGINNTQYNFTINLPDGYYLWGYWANDSANNINTSANRTLKVDTTAPAISIISPASGGSYSNNNSISLNYTVTDALSSLGLCVYNVLNSTGTQIANTTLPTCANTTFGLPSGDYDYNLTLYANDSLGNLGVKIVKFGVRTNAPAIILNYPTDNTFFNNGTNVYFNFTATDPDGVSMCRLYSNFTGSWVINESFVGITSGVQVSTQKNLTDNTYLWGLWCNDSLNNSGFSISNFTVNIDSVLPSVHINSITTTTGSQTFTFSSTESDNHLNNCFYSVYNSGGTIDGLNSNVSFTCNASIGATVTAYGTYNLVVYANDSASNLNSDTLGFTTSAIVPGAPGGGGGGSTTVTVIGVVAFKQKDLSKTYTQLDRARIYSIYYRYCNERPGETAGKCQLSTQQVQEVCHLAGEVFSLEQTDCTSFLLKYNVGDTEVYSEKLEIANQYALIRDVGEGVRFLLALNPIRIDSLWFRTDFSHSFDITANKPLKDCFIVTPKANESVGYNIKCIVEVGAVTGRIDLVSNVSQIFYVYDALIGWTATEKGETVYQTVRIRQISINGTDWYTFGLPLWGALIIYVPILGLLVYLIGFRGRKRRKKPSKSE